MRPRTLVAAVGAAVTLGLAPFVWTADGRPATRGSAGGPTGAAVFRSRGCAGCHTGPGVRSEINAGPSLVDAPAWAGERRQGMTAQEYLTQSIRHPSAFVSPAAASGGGPAGPVMPDLQLTDAEIQALVEYLLRP